MSHYSKPKHERGLFVPMTSFPVHTLEKNAAMALLGISNPDCSACQVFGHLFHSKSHSFSYFGFASSYFHFSEKWLLQICPQSLAEYWKLVDDRLPFQPSTLPDHLRPSTYLHEPKRKNHSRKQQAQCQKTPKFKIDRIVSHRFEWDSHFLLVLWSGYAVPTWEPAHVIAEDCPQLVIEFWNSEHFQNQKKKTGAKTN